MKNLKCKVGATLLTPICVALFIGFLLLLAYCMNTFGWVVWVVGGICGLFGLLAVCDVWIGLYEHCKNYWSKK